MTVFLFLLLDAALYSFCLYKVGDATLLWKETVLPAGVLAASLFFSVPAIFILSFLSPLEGASSRRASFKRTLVFLFPPLFLIWAFPALYMFRPLIPALLVLAALSHSSLPEKIKRGLTDVLVFLTLSFLMPLLASTHKPFVSKETSTAISFLWMPIEWHKLSMNIGLLVKSFPFFAAGVLMFHVLALYFFVRRGENKKIAVLYVLAAFFIISRISLMHATGRKSFFWAVFGFPYIMMALSAYTGKQKVFARFSVLAFAFTALWGFYTALLPFSAGSAALPPGFSRIYPKNENEKKIFPTEYMRDVYVDERAGYLYTCYGPTSGVVRINLKTGKADIIHTKGLLRHLWTDKNSHYLYGVDWIYDELWLIRKKDFKLEKTHFLWDPVLIAPIDIEVSDDFIFVVSTEYPALTRFDKETFKKTGQINFRKEGVTKFRSGAWVIARDAGKQKLFVEMGMVNSQDEFVLVRVDEKMFRVDGNLTLKGGGLTMIAVPEKRSILLGDFYSNLIYEIDMDTLRIKRKIPAVMNCRSLAYDAKRDVIYAASFITGDMVAVRYSDGEILKKVFVGKKPSEMIYSSERDALYFGSSAGVMKVNLKIFLSGL